MSNLSISTRTLLPPSKKFHIRSSESGIPSISSVCPTYTGDTAISESRAQRLHRKARQGSSTRNSRGSGDSSNSSATEDTQTSINAHERRNQTTHKTHHPVHTRQTHKQSKERRQNEAGKKIMHTHVQTCELRTTTPHQNTHETSNQQERSTKSSKSYGLNPKTCSRKTKRATIAQDDRQRCTLLASTTSQAHLLPSIKTLISPLALGFDRPRRCPFSNSDRT